MPTIILPNPAAQDLKLTFHDKILVFPSQKTEKRTLFLCNIDQNLNYVTSTLYFFAANPEFPPEYAAVRLKIALERVLVPFDFMAGRLKLNKESLRLEIDCNGAGAGFVVASSQFSLDEIGGLDRPNLGYRQLATQYLDNLVINSSDDDDRLQQPLCVFQVTSFKCGGFAIGMSMNHVLLDGMSAKIFKDSFASQAFEEGKPLPYTLCLDRTLLAARSPPLVQFPHPEFFKREPLSGPPVFNWTRDRLDYAIFKLRPNDINYLRHKCSGSYPTAAKISRFNLVAALIWKCKALSYDDGEEGARMEGRVSTLLIAVNIKPRLEPPLPADFCGNAVLCTCVNAECGEMQRGPFSKLVEMVGEGPSKMTNEYARSIIDWLEVNRGIIRGEYKVSSWLRLGFEEVNYPWGKPIHSCPVVSSRKDVCWLLPDGGGGAGIDAFVSLPPKEMEAFKLHFNQFFY